MDGHVCYLHRGRLYELCSLRKRSAVCAKPNRNWSDNDQELAKIVLVISDEGKRKVLDDFPSKMMSRTFLHFPESLEPFPGPLFALF